MWRNSGIRCQRRLRARTIAESGTSVSRSRSTRRSASARAFTYALDRPVLADERDLAPIAHEIVRVSRAREVGAFDDECARCAVGREAARRVERVHDRKAEPPAGLENTSRFTDRALHVVHVLQGPERHDQIERGVVERSTAATSWPIAFRSRDSLPSPQPRSSVRRSGRGTSSRNWSRWYCQ